MSRYYFDKSTGTFSDELLVAGFSYIMANIYDQLKLTPRITQRDLGAVYELTCEPTINWDQLANCIEPFYPFPILHTAKTKNSLPNDIPKIRSLVINEEQIATHPQRSTYWMIDDQTIRSGYNKLAIHWINVCKLGLMSHAIQLLMDLFSHSPNQIDSFQKKWREIIKLHDLKKLDQSAYQFFNPAQGKGINNTLPSGAKTLKQQKVFWLLEWLKIIGFFEIGVTNTFEGGQKAKKDRKTYVPAFGSMERQTGKAIFDEFQKSLPFSKTDVGSDILAILYYLKSMLSYAGQNTHQTDLDQESIFDDPFAQNTLPTDYLRGFQVAYYKALSGKAVTTMNLSFLNLPGWVTFERNLADSYKELLDEHAKIVRDLDQLKENQLDLLNNYRDFIVADNLDPFFDFTTAYSSYLISQGEKSRFPPKKFTTDNLRRLILNNKDNLSEILNRDGFKNVSTAIRKSTVWAQWRKSVKDDRYRVRYGLGSDLVRQSQSDKDFLSALSEFIFKYNAENAQVLERYPKEKYPKYKKFYRWDISTSDIAEITRLIDKYTANLIAKMLVAYGYARDSRNKDFDDADAPVSADPS